MKALGRQIKLFDNEIGWQGLIYHGNQQYKNVEE